MAISFTLFRKNFSKVIGELKGLSGSLNAKLLLFTGRSYEEVASAELTLNDSYWDPSKELINFASTMVELRLVREYNEYLSQEFHDLYEARTFRPSSSLNIGKVASKIFSEISWRCWKELDPPTTLTTFLEALEENQVLNVHTPLDKPKPLQLPAASEFPWTG